MPCDLVIAGVESVRGFRQVDEDGAAFCFQRGMQDIIEIASDALDA
jgi:hypothetical protein